MKKMNMLLCGLLAVSSVCFGAETFNWTNGSGDGDFNNPANWDAAPAGGNNYVNIGSLEANKAALAEGETLDFAGLRIGYSGGDGELVQTGGDFNATAVGYGATRLGANKFSGVYRMSGGTATFNALQLGLSDASSTGSFLLSGGEVKITGVVAQYSLRLGDTGRRSKGVFEVSGGSLQTRSDVRVSGYGTFAVLGSKSSAIQIGSFGALDGAWLQERGGVLKCRVAESGVTPIMIDDVQDPLDGDGNVIFCDGALLDVDFMDGALKGEWDVMRWEGTLVDYGLQLAPSVDTSVWSFSFVDTNGSGAPDTLRVKAGKNEPAAVVESKLTLDVLFDDFMVLQRDFDAPIWGTAPAGAVVTLQLDGQPVATAKADAEGAWTARIGKHSGDGGKPHTLTVSTPDEPEIKLTDVVFGDVYLCSGQSNMNRSLTVLGLGADIVTANHPQIRLIKAANKQSSSANPDPVVEYTWSQFSSAIAGEFTATGYFFATQLQAQTGEPVGLLYASWGGRPIRDFIAPEGMAMVPELAGVEVDVQNRVLRSYSSIYNGMIAPLAPYGVRGALWYQGEADSGRMGADLYRLHMQALVRGWRNVWGQEAFSFYYVQLPNYDIKADWPRFREAQKRFLAEPDTGMAVTIDIGNNRDIHPTNKLDVGKRLAAWAFAKDLGQDVVYSSPFFRSAKREGPVLRVAFDGVDGGLMVATKEGRNPPEKVDGPLQNFEVAGADKTFHAAEARIEDETVVVSSAAVKKPVYVRYCWDNTPDGANKLYDRAGFPASPFRNYTDYELKVSGGEGSAQAVEAGAVLRIAAAPEKEGQVFAHWIGGGAAVKDANACSTEVVMPEHDLYLVPVYQK
jgi:sialate O-acetylesterase